MRGFLEQSGQGLWQELLTQLSWIAHKQRTSVNSLEDPFGLCSRGVGGKEGCRKGTGTGGVREWSTAADIPSIATQLGGATSGCLCSPLGRSACTNKPIPGLWSNGNQTCSRTKSPLSPSLLFFSLPLSVWPTHTEGRTSIIPNRPENIPPFLFPAFPHSNGSWRSTFLHQRWPSWPWSSQAPVTCTYLHRHTFSHFQMLSLSLLLFPTFFPSIYKSHTRLSIDSCWDLSFRQALKYIIFNPASHDS